MSILNISRDGLLGNREEHRGNRVAKNEFYVYVYIEV